MTQKMERHIALAELHEDIPEENYEAFFNEARLTSSLRHPNIVTVYDYGFNQSHLPYFTMELKVGENLGDILENRLLERADLLDIFIKVCDAIAYSHSQGIIHLDLKPANIQVGKYGEVQVCDWGLSRRLGGVATGEGISGTPGYMAPEQTIKGKQLDIRTDVYALGSILYSLLTGERPIPGGLNTVLNATLHSDILPPSERCPDKNIPQSLDAVVNKAMSWSKDERYQSVEAFKNEVTQYLLGHSTNAEEAGFFRELSLFVKRNRQTCLVASGLILTLILLTIVFIVEIKKSQTETENAFRQLTEAHEDLQESRKQEEKLFKEKENTFKMYIQAAEERKLFSTKLVGQELNHAHELMIFPLYFGSPMKNLEKSRKILESHQTKNKFHKQVKDLLVLNLFISQNFSELDNYSSIKYAPLLEIAKKYKDNERSTTFDLLLDKDFLLLLEDLNALIESNELIKREVMERLICFALDKKGMNFIHGKMVRELILSWNPGWNPENFSHKKSDGYVRIKGEQLKKLKGRDLYSSGLSFLRLLYIKELDISESGLNSLSQLEGIKADTLDIRKTKIPNFHPHSVCKNINTLILNKGQIKADSNSRPPKGLKLVYRD